MATPGELDSFEQLLEHLRQTRGFDVTAYKRTSLMRRVLKRMHTVDVPTFDAYLDYLELHPDECASLFNTILINVTSFFRDPDVWAYLDTVILPELLDRRPESEPLRVWSAGCASGEEAYSVAMLLAERLGTEGLCERAKIYATDVVEEALTDARRAVFSVKDTAALPPGFADTYFSIDENGATLTRELRRAVMFGRIDLLKDAPISRIDLLLCRNTLMYFTPDAQKRVLSRFSCSMDAQGFLVLGRPEMLFRQTALFVPADLPRRVFRVVGKASYRDRVVPPGTGRDSRSTGSNPLRRLRQAPFDARPTPQPVVNSELHASKQELETVYEELQSTNEELQSTVEELETTNEELQSANEELETMNEELQSTNEELRTINDELRTSRARSS